MPCFHLSSFFGATFPTCGTYILDILSNVIYSVFCIWIFFYVLNHTLGSGIYLEISVHVTMVIQLVLKLESRSTNGAPVYSMLLFDKVHVCPVPLLRRTPCHRFFFYTKNGRSAHLTHGYLTPFVNQIFVCKIHTAYMCVEHLI